MNIDGFAPNLSTLTAPSAGGSSGSQNLFGVASFALLFWQLDAGGPAAQAMGGKSPRDWLFPQADTLAQVLRSL